MDSHEAARALLFTRIQGIDPHNALKILAFILLQEKAEENTIRLALGPDNLLHSLIATAKTQFRRSSVTSLSNPISISRPHTEAFNPSSPDFSPQNQNGLHNYPSQEQSLEMATNTACFGYNPSPPPLRKTHSRGDAFLDPADNSNIDSLEHYLEMKRLNAAHYMYGVNRERSAAASAMMTGDEFNKLNRCWMRRNEFSESAYPASKQIYLTFPADSIFKEEDVSNYFSLYGPVQDVRIPYQHKRMFGFVTFVYAQTVKIILSTSNPHFICDSRVLVKPYKEKGELLDKKQQLLDNSEFFSSPDLHSYEPFEMHVGPRLFHKNHEMMLRMKLEQEKLEQESDWQQALQLQSRRMMNLQLLDLKNGHDYQQNPSLASAHYSLNYNGIGSPKGAPTGHVHEGGNGITKEDNSKPRSSDGFFGSVTNSASGEQSVYTPNLVGLDEAAAISYSSAKNDHSAPAKSCFLEIPRVSLGHEAIMESKMLSRLNM